MLYTQTYTDSVHMPPFQRPVEASQLRSADLDRVGAEDLGRLIGRGYLDRPEICEGGGRSSRVEPAREDKDTTNSVRGILIESKRQPGFYIQLAAVHRSAAQWERYPLLGNSACRTGFNGKLRTQWEICGLRTNAFEARVSIGVKFHSFEGGAVHVAVQLRAECENGTAWGCFWALLRSSVADFAVRRSFDVEEEGRRERGVEGDMLDGD
ncbi:hypothetical protein DFH09DRAFT_1101718 [Mycena vulgaris]|nr:hypothetical protein DFH09DRAFT_1101718 [Mycena vulgaris]